jgi:ATP-dependent DNA ligase
MAENALGLTRGPRLEVPSAGDVLVAEGALVFVKACELGLEGIVSKRVGSRHSSGNSRQWVKSKNPAFER